MGIDLDGIYAAIEDDIAFDGLSGRIAEACNTRSAIFVNLTKEGMPTFVQANYWTEAFKADYLQEFITTDPWTRTAIKVGRFGRAAALDGAMLPEEFIHTAMYNDLFRAHGDDTGRCLGVMPALGRDGLMMAVHRAVRDDAFTIAEEQRLDEVYAHIQRVVSLRKTLASARSHGARLQDIVDRSGDAILRIDRDLRVVAISAAAEHLLEARDGLALRNRRIVAPAAIRAELTAAVAAIIDRTGQARTALLCPRPSGRRPYRLVLLPAGFDSTAGALLRIDDPDDMPRPGWQRMIRDAYHLTAMEADLAERLYAEYSLDEIAMQRGVSRETIRSQLKSLLSKTGVGRQSTLVKLLATLPKGG